MLTTVINEELLPNTESYPVFIVLTRGKTFFSGPIKTFSSSPYTHASITLDPELRYFYSYNIIDNYNKGFIMETRHTLSKSEGVNISVLFVDKKTLKKIARNLKKYSDNRNKTQFAIRRLFGAAFGLGKETNPWKQVCSSFVHGILSDAGVKLCPDDIKCVKPSDLADSINNNKKYIYQVYDGSIWDIDSDDIKLKIDQIRRKKHTQLFDQEKIVLTETISPESVDRSKYDHFNLFNFFDIYTTDYTLKEDPQFNTKMKWVKDRIFEICELAGWNPFPYEITLCNSFEDLDEFYNHEAPKWVTGFTYGDKVYMKAPHIYPGNLYYNIVLHECIHVQIFLNEKRKNRSISREDEEGMAVFFSTPLNEWLKELNHGPNWYYYESAIRVQDDFIRGGMKYVIKNRFKQE